MNDSRCFGYKYDMAYEIDNRILDTIELDILQNILAF